MSVARETRTVLFTGKGGVGKSTAAAATACAAAADGMRTLVISTDAAHSLADAFDASVAGVPTQVADDLFVQQVDAQRQFEQAWDDVQVYLRSVLDSVGVDPIRAEELTVLPGAEEVLALLELRAQVRSQRWDVVIVDCAPTAETMRLLALPEALGWYMDRILPVERRVVRLLKPVLTKAAGVPMPRDSVFSALERLHADLADVREVLLDERASVRLVLTPESVVVAEARRSLTLLSLFGYRVDGVVANRIFPSEGADVWRQGWVDVQSRILAEVEESFAGMEIWRSAYRPREPVGLTELESFARDLYAGTDPLAQPTGPGPVELRRDGRQVQLRVALPFADRGDVDLARRGDDLVVTIGSYRRVLAVPDSLRGTRVLGAAMSEETLVVRFEGRAAATSHPRSERAEVTG